MGQMGGDGAHWSSLKCLSPEEIDEASRVSCKMMHNHWIKHKFNLIQFILDQINNWIQSISDQINN